MEVAELELLFESVVVAHVEELELQEASRIEYN
jgi:hypothetical protein